MKKSGRLLEVTGTAFASLEDHIERSSLTESHREALQKDRHLIKAAIEADRRIVSCEELARRLFGQLAAEFPTIPGAERLHEVLWISPIRPEEDALGWLTRGCPLVPGLLLGALKT
ncbi:MAG: hypothetical protein NT069_07470 [Planctomycetota bacterium]|nr:hypothetical protein [Planctomycetota bacterium]